MRLRTTALIAGLLGVIALAVGLVAQSQRPETTVTVGASVDTAAVVIPADMLAFAGDAGRYAVDGAGPLVALSALPGDMEAWAADRSVTYVTAMPTWETLATELAEPEPDPSASASASASAEAEPSPSPSVSEDAGPEYESVLEGSADHWRDSWAGTDRLSVGGANVESGLWLVFASEDGSPLTGVDLTLSRDINDAWVAPLIVWGAILTAVGLIALALLLIDVRPVQARAEEWMAHRQRIGSGDAGPKPGSRRARRLEGAAVPEAELDDEPDPPATPSTPPATPAATAAASAPPFSAAPPRAVPGAAPSSPTPAPGHGHSPDTEVTSARTPFAVGGASSAVTPAAPPTAPSPWAPVTPGSATTPSAGTPASAPSAATPQHQDFLPPAQPDKEDDR